MEVKIPEFKKANQAQIEKLISSVQKLDEIPFAEHTCWHILNLHTQRNEFTSKGSEKVFGLSQQAFEHMSICDFEMQIDEDDLNILKQYAIPDLIKQYFKIPEQERPYLSVQLNYQYKRPDGQLALMLNHIQVFGAEGYDDLSLALVKCNEIDFPRKSPGVIAAIKSFKDPKAPERLFLQRYFPYAWMRLLSEREVEILGRIIAGENSLDISKQLFISRNTVDTHRRNILKKLDASSSTDVLIKLFGTHLSK